MTNKKCESNCTTRTCGGCDTTKTTNTGMATSTETSKKVVAKPKLVSAVKGRGLVKGMRDTKVIQPLATLQMHIEEMEKAVNQNFDTINRNRFTDFRNTMMKFQELDGHIRDFNRSIQALASVLGVDTALLNVEKDKLEDVENKRKLVDKVSTDSDIVRFSFVGKIDGKEFPGGSLDDFHLDLANSTFIPGFAEQLVGVKAGDVKDVNTTFPTDYQNKDLAGKDATFTCTVKSVKEKIVDKTADTTETIEEVK